MERREKIKKEIKKWQKMLREERGSLWASENETCMEEKEQLVRDLKSQLKGYDKALKDFSKELNVLKNAPNEPDYYEEGKKRGDWDNGYDACLDALEEYF